MKVNWKMIRQLIFPGKEEINNTKYLLIKIKGKRIPTHCRTYACLFSYLNNQSYLMITLVTALFTLTR